MGSYSTEHFTIRRKDGKPITQEDLKAFEQFMNVDFPEMHWVEMWETPFICRNDQEIYASCQIKWTLETSEIRPFARNNPHLQIEVIENCDDDDVGVTRYLFEGDIVEVLSQITRLEEPKKIDWPSGPSRYRSKLKDDDFLSLFGEQIVYAIQDMLQNTDWHSLGKYVIESMIHNPDGEDMFSAVVGWDMDDLITRANNELEYWRK